MTTKSGWLNNGFWIGLLASFGGHVFVEDLVGKEKWLKMVDDGWITMSPLIGAGILVLVTVLYGANVYLSLQADKLDELEKRRR